MKKLLAALHFSLLFKILIVTAVFNPSGPLSYSAPLLGAGLALSCALFFSKKYSALCLIGLCAIWIVFTNSLSRNAAHEFMLWMTLASVFDDEDSPLGVPDDFFRNGVWVLFGINYFYSGIEKLRLSFWRSGEALDILILSPIANTSVFSDILRSLPLAGLTYLVVLIEIAILPLSLYSRTRKLAWLAMMLLQVGIFLAFRLWEISLVLLVLQMRLYQKDFGLVPKFFNLRVIGTRS